MGIFNHEKLFDDSLVQGISFEEWKKKPENQIEKWCITFLNWKPFAYQLKFLKECLTNKYVAGLWCRQSGKSSTISKYCLFKAIRTPDTTILIVAPSQRQSSELFLKMKIDIENNDAVGSYVRNSTATEIVFNNGSRIKALPSGPEGKTIRGFTADIIIIEEAGEMKTTIVNTVLMPMIGTKTDKDVQRQIIKIGTPHGRNHFYDSCKASTSKYAVVTVPWQRAVEEGILDEDLVMDAKELMSSHEFKMEWDALFPDEADSFFTWELIQSCVEEYKTIKAVH